MVFLPWPMFSIKSILGTMVNSKYYDYDHEKTLRTVGWAVKTNGKQRNLLLPQLIFWWKPLLLAPK